jgi:hypothetical protein
LGQLVGLQGQPCHIHRDASLSAEADEADFFRHERPALLGDPKTFVFDVAAV